MSRTLNTDGNRGSSSDADKNVSVSVVHNICILVSNYSFTNFLLKVAFHLPGTFSRNEQVSVDLTKLEVGCSAKIGFWIFLKSEGQAPSLRKYRRVFKLGEVQQGGTKDELIPAVVRHWKQTIVDEDETLIAFVTALRQRAKRGNIQAVNNRHSSFKTNSTRSGPRGKGK